MAAEIDVGLFQADVLAFEVLLKQVAALHWLVKKRLELDVLAAVDQRGLGAEVQRAAGGSAGT